MHETYGETVKFTYGGFPIFDEFVRGIAGTPADLVMDWTKAGTTRESHYRYCDKQMGVTERYPRNHTLTWQHHQDKGRMQLVPTKFHGPVKLTGGFAIWGKSTP
ncbi:HNH endonuclease [Corynebacterium felinum]|uniref:Transposase n=1 Tax=Corynebacterium felinum TaxID=131318 RepID=A0ABU2BBC7_9CORY|nr:HNH endonuclease [Corynebacterium felinum]MDF5819926.1 HNH endonuclease [Corynebacterium felinum]MDR7355930.1 hypothetical protein [Corynebacterium felinum]